MTHYEMLGLDRGFTADELKDRWRTLARETHPDREGGDASKFAEVSCAYAVLSDPRRRKAYDATLDLLTEPCARCGGEGRVWRQRGFTGRTAGKCGECNGTGRVGR